MLSVHHRRTGWMRSSPDWRLSFAAQPAIVAVYIAKGGVAPAAPAAQKGSWSVSTTRTAARTAPKVSLHAHCASTPPTPFSALASYLRADALIFETYLCCRLLTWSGNGCHLRGDAFAGVSGGCRIFTAIHKGVQAQLPPQLRARPLPGVFTQRGGITVDLLRDIVLDVVAGNAFGGNGIVAKVAQTQRQNHAMWLARYVKSAAAWAAAEEEARRRGIQRFIRPSSATPGVIPAAHPALQEGGSASATTSQAPAGGMSARQQPPGTERGPEDFLRQSAAAAALFCCWRRCWQAI